MNLRRKAVACALPIDWGGQILAWGIFRPMIRKQYGIYVNKNQPLVSLSATEPFIYSVNLSASFSYPFGANANYWIGVSAIASCAVESSAASWFSVQTDGSGNVLNPYPPEVRNLTATSKLSAQISINFSYVPGPRAVEPDSFKAYELPRFDGPEVLLTTITYVAGNVEYSATVTPSLGNGWIKVDALKGTSINKVPVMVSFKTDSAIPAGTVTATIE